MSKEKRNISRGLVIIDMNKGFLEEGLLAAPSIKRNILDENVRLAGQFLASGDPVFVIKDVHDENSTEMEDFPDHCKKGTKEIELVEPLKSMEKDFLVFEKNCISLREAPGLVEEFDKYPNLEHLVFTGCLSEFCVGIGVISLRSYFNQQNRRAANGKRIELVVPENAIDTFDAPGHERDVVNQAAFVQLRANGIDVVPRYAAGYQRVR